MISRHLDREEPRKAMYPAGRAARSTP